MQRGLVSERSSRNVTDSRKKLQLSPLIKHTNSANCNDKEPFWIQFPAGVTMKRDSTLGLRRLQNDITSCVDIYMQQDKQQTAGRWCWWTHVCWFESSLNPVWIWFVWTQSERLHGGPMGICSANWWGQGRSLGSIGNMKKQFSLYYIYLFKVISIQHKHTFSPHIMYFNMNNSYQHHHLIQKFSICQRCLFVVVVLVLCSSCGFYYL